MRIGDAVAPPNRTPKILGVTLDTHFTFAPHARDCVERASRALKVMKATAGSNWSFTTETLVATYKAIVRPILNYAARILFTQLPSSHLDKLEVIQNKFLRIATGCHQKAAVSHLRVEIGVLPLSSHLELCCQQFYASALQPLHPQSPPRPTPASSGLPSTGLQASYHRPASALLWFLPHEQISLFCRKIEAGKNARESSALYSRPI